MITRFFQIFVSLTLMATLTACGADQTSENAEKDASASTAKTISSETAKPGLPFPVYENFSDLEYIFQYQNDTTYVINFWATWCKPCVEELPYFEQLHAEKGSDKLKVILVSLDFAKDVPTKLASFVQKRQLKPEVIALIDGQYNNWIDKVHPDWGGAIPVTYIYRGDQVIFHDQQYDSYEDLRASVGKINRQG